MTPTVLTPYGAVRRVGREVLADHVAAVVLVVLDDVLVEGLRDVLFVAHSRIIAPFKADQKPGQGPPPGPPAA